MRILLVIAAVAAGLLVDRVSLVVNDEPVFESQIARRAATLDSRDQAIEQLVDESLWLARAREIGVTVDADEVDRAIEEIETSNGLDDAGLAAALADQHWTMPDYREELERELLLLKTQNLVTAGTDAADREDAVKQWIAERREHAYIERRDQADP